MRKITLELVCELSPDELLSRGADLSAAVERLEAVENDKRDAMKEFKEELDALRQRKLRLSRIITDRAETRSVECSVLFHCPVQATERIARLDTGEFVRDEPMTTQEMQQHLFTPRNEPEQLEIPEAEEAKGTEVTPDPEPEQPAAD